MLGIIIYTALQLLNVVFGTARSILTIKGTAMVAAITTAIACTLSAVVTKCVSEQVFPIIIAVTFITNILGVPLATWIVNKTQKEKLWVYTATVKCTEDTAIQIKHLLKSRAIKSVYEEISPDEMYEVRIFANHKAESRIIRDLLKSYNAKYYIIEPK